MQHANVSIARRASALYARLPQLWPSGLLIACCLTTACSISCPRAEAETYDPAWQADSQLCGVCYADSQHVWAVGDRGALWHSDDSGAHWRLQASGVDCRLASVSFVNARLGWAAGGFWHAPGQTSQGVLLRTEDGGASWRMERKLPMPALSHIHFFDAKRGWALSEPASLFPSGAFVTNDGGHSWTALPCEAESAPLCGAMLDPASGALAGRDGFLARVERGTVRKPTSEFSLRSWRAMRLDARGRGCLVGDGASVLQTRDYGFSWQTPAQDLGGALHGAVDFYAAAMRGDRLWVAGSPGSRVWRSEDDGQSWQAFATGVSAPIRAIAFADDNRGCAVGDLGTILTTTDGGATWRIAQRGGARAALLCVAARARKLPLPAIAQAAADDGYLTAAFVVGRDDFESSAPRQHEDRLHAGLLACGASHGERAWRFPLRRDDLYLSSQSIVDLWDRAEDGDALARLDEQLVVALRTWRPDVVVLSATPSDADPLEALVAQALLRAVEHAADPGRYPDQIARLGLEQWRATKIFAALPSGERGGLMIDAGQLSTRLGHDLAEMAEAARDLMAVDQTDLGGAAHDAFRAATAYRLLLDKTNGARGDTSLFAGIAVAPGDGRRKFSETPTGNLDALRRTAERRRNLEAIFAQVDQRASGDHFVAAVGPATERLPASQAARVLFHLSEQYRRAGRFEAAAETLDLLAARYPDSPAAAAALTFLVQYHASGECAWRLERASQARSQDLKPLTKSQAEPATFDTRSNAPIAGPGRTIVATAVMTPNVGAGLIETRAARAAAYAAQLEQLQPAVHAEPNVRFPLAVAHRKQGYPRQADKFFASFARGRADDAWRDCALVESWLAGNHATLAPAVGALEAPQRAVCPKPRFKCAKAEAPPKLDGDLSDPCWISAEPIVLRSPQQDDNAWPAAVLLTYDAKFLYLAATCRKAPELIYAQPARRNRRHDESLEQHDRVAFSIDIDRDWTTSYRLAVDERGATHDECWHDSSWNPSWYVASAADDSNWRIEAAVPLSELQRHAPAPKHVWAVGVERIVPGVGWQSSSVDRSGRSTPEAFGLLEFE